MGSCISPAEMHPISQGGVELRMEDLGNLNSLLQRMHSAKKMRSGSRVADWTGAIRKCILRDHMRMQCDREAL